MPEPDSQASNLARRVLSAFVFVPAVVLLVESGDGSLLVLVLLIVGRGAWEFYRMGHQAGHRPARLLGLVLALGLCGYLHAVGPGQLAPIIAAAALITLGAVLVRGTENYTANALLTLGE